MHTEEHVRTWGEGDHRSEETSPADTSTWAFQTGRQDVCASIGVCGTLSRQHEQPNTCPVTGRRPKPGSGKATSPGSQRLSAGQPGKPGPCVPLALSTGVSGGESPSHCLSPQRASGQGRGTGDDCRRLRPPCCPWAPRWPGWDRPSPPGPVSCRLLAGLPGPQGLCGLHCAPG